MNEELLLAIRESEAWLDLFKKRFYRKAFKKYRDRFEPAFEETFRICSDEPMMQNVAEWMLTELEKGWKRQRFWNRSAVRGDEKQMVIVYLSPMLLAMENPTGPRFAKLLRDNWAARWPKDSYEIASFEILMKGFNASILGVDLKAFQKEEEDED